MGNKVTQWLRQTPHGPGDATYDLYWNTRRALWSASGAEDGAKQYVGTLFYYWCAQTHDRSEVNLTYMLNMIRHLKADPDLSPLHTFETGYPFNNGAREAA